VSQPIKPQLEFIFTYFSFNKKKLSHGRIPFSCYSTLNWSRLWNIRELLKHLTPKLALPATMSSIHPFLNCSMICSASRKGKWKVLQSPLCRPNTATSCAKVKFSLCLTKYHTMNTYRGVGV
jgi:hypothetical protein